MVTTQGTTWQFLAGRYRLIDLIGEGANGSAWRAEDVELGRPVAVNELRFDGELDERTKRRLVARMLKPGHSASSRSTSVRYSCFLTFQLFC